LRCGDQDGPFAREGSDDPGAGMRLARAQRVFPDEEAPGVDGGGAEERRKERTGRFMCRRAISATERPSTERIVGIRPRRMLAPAMLCVMSGVMVWMMQLLCVQQ